MRCLLLFGSLLQLAQAHAQSGPNDSAAVSPDRLIGYSFANDAYFRTDYYFTQGMTLNVVHPGLRHSPVNRVLLRPRAGSTSYFGVRLRYDGFTPLRIQDPFIRVGDRPYASYIYAALYRMANNPSRRQRLTSAVNLGFIGPAAGAKGFQTTLHEWLGAPTPRGWDYQVQNDVVLGYQLGAEKQLAAVGRLAELIGTADASLGTLYTYASAGGLLRVGKLNPYFQNLGLTSRTNRARLRKFQLYAQARTEARLIGYDATLQGGLLNRHNSYTLSANQVKRGVLRSSAGLVVAYGGVSVETSAAFVSPEFDGARRHKWVQFGLEAAF
ncbi:lipid A deacylase LpxR family protein [Hymenobacter busanensis]